MKALTLWQPWASLMAWGVKNVETRIWQTSYRGPLAIHAAANVPKILGASRYSAEFVQYYRRTTGDNTTPTERLYDKLPRGAVVCIVELIDCAPTHRVRDDISPTERAFGNYEDGRYAWWTKPIETFEQPIPAKGNRMLWEWRR